MGAKASDCDGLPTKVSVLRAFIIFTALCDLAFLGPRRREVRNPTQRAGRIPLSGLVLVHSRHHTIFRRAAKGRRYKKAAYVGSGQAAVWSVS